MKLQILNKLFVGFIVGSLSGFGLPWVAFTADPCNSEYGDANFTTCESGKVYDVSGANEYGLYENGTDITSYAYELQPWGAGSSICKEIGLEPDDGGPGSNMQYEKIPNCTIPSGWWYSDLDYTNANCSPFCTAPVTWYY